ncbi:MAG TPA: ABC transporter substrate-binding protein [Alcaligenaceae bacterium]|nr:ABC transporter substrate-binding protein [Alcaligenaceae bacterium]
MRLNTSSVFAKLAAGFLSLWGLLTVSVSAQTNNAYPNRAVTITVPYPAGGATDMLARGLGQKLSEKWGRPVVVENKPGGGSLIGSEAVARANPDGYHLLLTITTLVQAPHLRIQKPFDPTVAFTPIAMVARTPLIMVVHPDVKAKTPADLVALAKANPGKFSYGTYGNGTSAHFYGYIFNKQTGLEMEHVAYKGEAPSVNDLLGGQIPVVIMSGVGAAANIQAGKMRGLAVTGPTRAPIFPDIPTFKELGYTGMADIGWFGMFAPAGTPSTIVDKISNDVRDALKDPALLARMAKMGLELTWASPKEFSEDVRQDYKKWGEVVEEIGIKLD